LMSLGEVSSKEEVESSKNENEGGLFTISFDPTIFGRTLQQSFKNLYDSPLLADVTLILSEHEKIKGHKVILSSSSTRLKKLFENENVKEYVMSFDTAEEREHFKMMILYIYSGNIQVVSSQIIPLLAMAHNYGVIPLKEACGEALGNTLESSSVFYLLDVAEKYECTSLRSKCGKYLAENFGDLMEMGRLMPLDVDTWVEMIKNDEIKVKSEAELLKFIIQYAMNIKEKEKSMDALERMLPHIRFPYLPVKTLVELESDERMKGVKCLHELLFDAYKYKALPQKAKKGLRRRKFVDIFTWNPDSSIKLSDDGLTVQKTATNGWNLRVTGNVEFDSGNPSWEITLDHVNNDRSGLVIGIAPKDHPVASFDQCVGIGMSGGMYRTTAKLSTSSASVARKVRVEVDFLNKTASFYLDGSLYATGHFEWKIVVPSVFMHYVNDKITLGFNPDA